MGSRLKLLPGWFCRLLADAVEKVPNGFAANFSPKDATIARARPASLRTSGSPSAKQSCSAPFAIRSTARYRRSSWGKRKDDERHRSQAVHVAALAR
jgi:hypothetical protein